MLRLEVLRVSFDLMYRTCFALYFGGGSETAKAAAPAAAPTKAPKATSAPKPTVPHAAKPMGPGVKMEKFASMAELPSKYKRKPLTAEEIEYIDVRRTSVSVAALTRARASYLVHIHTHLCARARALFLSPFKFLSLSLSFNTLTHIYS